MKQPAVRRRVLILTGAVVVALSTLASAVRARAQQPPSNQPVADISPEALGQIEALLREKASRSSVQQKIDSQLIYELKMQAGQPIASGIDTLETDIPYADDGHAIVDVKAHATDELMASLRAFGVEVLSSSAGESSLRLHIDIDQVEALAALPDVTFVQPRQEAITARQQAQPDVIFGTGVGSKTSEGDRTHRAFVARGALGADGTGVKIGVLSDGVTNLAASQASGDLGSVTVLPGQAGAGDEGTAMLEIIHDLAPGAQMYFATAITSITSFANNIRALRAVGCDIIVDDVFYFVETPFQDGQASGVISNTNGGVVIQAVNDVIADGALYFSSAGNSGNLNDGTSGTWEGDFVDGGAVAPPITAFEGPAARLHSFGAQTFNVMIAPGRLNNLYWSDPLGGSSNDYDLFRLNAAGTTVQAASLNTQNGTQDPYEQISAGAAGARLVVVKFSGAPRFLHLDTTQGRLSIATAGQIHGHAGAMNATAVAATPAVGPFPNAFSGSNVVETFSSDGPRRVFFQANGTAITPGNFSSSGGLLRQKPNITAADGVSVTGAGGFPNPFFGTSAAAPHAAAIAALVKSANPAFTPTQIRAFLSSAAIDIEAPGIDRDSGAGIVMPYAALLAAGFPGSAFVDIDSFDALDNPGNGNGRPEAGEGARLAIVLKNYGVQNATAVSAALTSSTPGISVTLPNGSSYPDLPVSVAAPNASPLLFTVASDFPCLKTADFTLIVNYSGGPSPKAFTFPVPIGPPPFTVARNLDGTTPPTSPGVFTAAGSQVGRLFRDGVASACGAQKVINAGGANNPVDASLRRYESFQFNTCANSPASCAVVTLQGTNAVSLFTAAYAPAFNPGNILQGYRGDPGASAASRTYAFDVPAGPTSFAIDVHDVPISATPSGTLYTLTVSGACLGACTPPNHVPVAKARNVTVFADNSCSADASIDDGSSDEDGDALTITQSPAGPYPLGATTVLLTVTDTKGATSQATGTVTVVDNEPPSVSAFSLSAPPLWPPNHQMVDVTVNYGLSDNCDSVSCVLSVTSNEPDNGLGDGNTDHDWEIVDARHLRVRAERSGKGDGRVYTVALTCTDSAGNKTVRTGTLTVPHNR